MKTAAKMDPDAAFPDATQQPDTGALKKILGAASTSLEQTLAEVRAVQPAVTTEWRFSDRSGWHQIVSLKKRRLFYLVPRRGDFRISLILGGKAIARLQQGPFVGRTNELLKRATHYPEGTAFSFDRRTLAPKLIAAFLAAKLAR